MTRNMQFRIVVCCVLAAAAAAGCVEKGTIVVDRPEVFTRERLVNRRLKETEFLEGKLGQPFIPTKQGYQDTREFSGMMAQLSGQFDPLGGAVVAAGRTAQLATAQRADQLAQLQHRIDLAKKRKELLNELQPPKKAKTGASDGDGGGDANAGDDDQVGNGNGSDGDASGGKTDEPLADLTLMTSEDAGKQLAVFKTENRPSVPSAADLVQSLASPTMIDSDRDELARRDFIHANLRERELDDTHDLRGYTIYTLKFDVTVIPGKDNAQLGRVNLAIEPESSLPADLPKLKDDGGYWPSEPGRTPQESEFKLSNGKTDEALFRRSLVEWGHKNEEWTKWVDLHKTYMAWRRSLQEEVQREALALQHRHAEGLLSLDERTRLASMLAERDPDNITTYRAGLQAQARQPVLHQTEAQQAKSSAQAAMAHFAELRYTRLLQHLCMSFSSQRLEMEGIAQGQHNVTYYLPRLEGKPGAAETMIGNPEFRKFAVLVGELRRQQRRSPLRDALLERSGLKIERIDQILNDEDEGEAAARTSDSFVYSVEPKEYAQNISDVAATEKLSSFVLSVRAALPQAGVNAAGYLNRMRDTQSRLQALLRRPLVVGYVNGPLNLGWIVGPRFEIGQGRNRNVEFRQAHVQHSLQASIAVPAWERKLVLKGNYQWGHDRPRKLWGGPSRRTIREGAESVLRVVMGTPDDESKIEVALPADPSALTRAMVAHLDGFEQRSPALYPRHEPDGRPQFIVRASTEPQTLVIRGAELWRNPVVFVGEHRASRLEVLPDMKGVLATFQRIDLPPRVLGAEGASADGRQAKLDLRIVTSGGESVLPGAVTVVPVNAGGASDAPQAELASASITLKEVLHVAVDAKTFPSGFDALRVRVRPSGEQHVAWVETKSEPDREGPDRVAVPFELSTTQPWLGQDRELQVELAQRPIRGHEFQRVPFRNRDSIVFFTSDSRRKLKLVTEAVTFDANQNLAPPVIELSFNSDVELITKAYPGLRDALNAQKEQLTVVLLAKDKRHPVPARFVKDRIAVDAQALRTDADGRLIDAGEYELEVRYGPKNLPPVPVEGKLKIEKKP